MFSLADKPSSSLPSSARCRPGTSACPKSFVPHPSSPSFIMAARVQPTPRRTRRTSPRPTLFTPTTLQRIHPSSAKPVAIVWAPSGTYLAVATQHGPVFLFYVLTAKNDVVRSNPIRTFRGHAADVLHMSFSTSDFLLTASMDRSIRLWHAEVNVCLRRFLHPDMVTTVTFHPLDHNFVLSGGCDGVVRIWRLSDHACVAQVDVGAVVTAAQFACDGNRAFVGTYDGRVVLLDIKELIKRASENFNEAVIKPNSSRDGNTNAPGQTAMERSGGVAVIKVEKTIDIRQRRSRRKSPGPKVGGICVRTRQKETIVVGSDARVHVFGIEGEVVNRLKAGFRKDGTVTLGCSVSPDGRYMLHDAVGGVVRMLDLNGRQRVESNKRRERELPIGVESVAIVMEENVSCAAFASSAVLEQVKPGRNNSDGYVMAVGVDDGSVRIVHSGM